MDQAKNYENDCERYLLGTMPEQEQEHFEEQYFENDELFERFLAVKDGLIDAYARGELRADLRPQFEQHFLTTEPRRQRVEEARQFIKAINASAPTVPVVEQTASDSWWHSVSATVGLPPLVFQGALVGLIAITLLGGLLWLRNSRNRQAEQARALDQGQQVPPTSTRLDKSSPQDASASPTVDDRRVGPTASPSPTPSPSVNRQPSQPAPSQIASLTLIPFAPRDGSGSNTLQLAPDTRAVRLNLTFKKDEYSSYSVALKTLTSDEVFKRRGLKPQSSASGSFLTLTVDPALLTHQDYILVLSGLSKSGQTESLADYYFRVQRMPSR